MIKAFNSNRARLKRHLRARNRIQGSPARPRLCVFRSLDHIYAQVIDDVAGHTLVAASSRDKGFERPNTQGKIAVATAVGRTIAERAKEKGVTTVVFDRGGYLYHGRVAALAQAAREAGLIF